MIPLNILNIKSDYYEIEEDGAIYSKQKKGYMNTSKDKDGYLRVGLRTNDNKQTIFRIATLVGYTFLGNPPDNLKDPTINHINGNILDNHYSNLEWVERGYNSSIRNNKGTGSNNHQAILNEEQVIEICEILLNSERTATDIAKQYNVSASVITNILQRRNWNTITCKYDFSCRSIIRGADGRFHVYNSRLHGSGK